MIRKTGIAVGRVVVVLLQRSRRGVVRKILGGPEFVGDRHSAKGEDTKALFVRRIGQIDRPF